MSHLTGRIVDFKSQEVSPMFRKMIVGLPHDPDALVFWLTTTLCSLFLLFAPVVPGGMAAL